jgi:Luciferase-like monooxygenase
VKLGILRYSGIWNIDSLVEDVASAAAAGFSSYWIPNLGVAVDNLMALAIAGREVPEIELGAGVVPTRTRHPLVMGQSALTASSVIGCPWDSDSYTRLQRHTTGVIRLTGPSAISANTWRYFVRCWPTSRSSMSARR